MTPIAGASPQSFVSQWQASRKVRDPRFLSGLGFGYGADMNGLAEESQPTGADPISYPFRSYDGQVTFTKEQWGQRTFDLNTDGVANYGMFPDWLQELQLAGRPIPATCSTAPRRTWRCGSARTACRGSTASRARAEYGSGCRSSQCCSRPDSRCPEPAVRIATASRAGAG